MRIANRFVALLLRSPLHRMLSGKVLLIRYEGRRTGVRRSTPTQYVELGDGGVGIVVGDPERKQWWRNFREPRLLELLVRGEWRRTTARTHWHHAEPARVDVVMKEFDQKYGRAHQRDSAADVLIVLCVPVPSSIGDEPSSQE